MLRITVSIVVFKFTKNIQFSKILEIQENVSLLSIFKFETVTCEDIKIIINGLDTSKSAAFKNIPVKIFRNHTDAFADKLTNIVNHSI